MFDELTNIFHPQPAIVHSFKQVLQVNIFSFPYLKILLGIVFFLPRQGFFKFSCHSTPNYLESPICSKPKRAVCDTWEKWSFSESCFIGIVPRWSDFSQTWNRWHYPNTGNLRKRLKAWDNLDDYYCWWSESTQDDQQDDQWWSTKDDQWWSTQPLVLPRRSPVTTPGQIEARLWQGGILRLHWRNRLHSVQGNTYSWTDPPYKSQGSLT